MTATIRIAKRLVPLEQIVLVEPFVAEENARIFSERPLKTRVVLLNRTSLLTEDAVEAFAEQYGFRTLFGEGIAANPSVAFGVETFAPQEGFSPTRPFLSRLTWKDETGQTQSKLLLATPESVLRVIIRGEPESTGDAKPEAKRHRRSKRQRAEPEPS